MDAQNHHYPSHPPSHRHHDHHDPFCGVGHPVAMVVSGGRGRGGAGRGGDGGGGGGFGFVVVVFMVVCCPSRRYTCPCSRLPAAVASSPTDMLYSTRDNNPTDRPCMVLKHTHRSHGRRAKGVQPAPVPGRLKTTTTTILCFRASKFDCKSWPCQNSCDQITLPSTTPTHPLAQTLFVSRCLLGAAQQRIRSAVSCFVKSGLLALDLSQVLAPSAT